MRVLEDETNFDQDADGEDVTDYSFSPDQMKRLVALTRESSTPPQLREILLDAEVRLGRDTALGTKLRREHMLKLMTTKEI